jgi:hypothetical protein
MSVIIVISATFPPYLSGFPMTVNWWCVLGASLHRHGDRHRENGLDKRFSRHHDARDAHLRVFSRQGGVSVLRRPLPLQPNPTMEAESRIAMRFMNQ